MNVQQFIADELGLPISEVKPDSSIRLLITDSLEMVYLMQELECKYGVVIPSEQIGRFLTVGDIISFLEPN